MNRTSPWKRKGILSGVLLFVLGASLSIVSNAEAIGFLMYLGIVIFVVDGALWFKARFF